VEQASSLFSSQAGGTPAPLWVNPTGFCAHSLHRVVAFSGVRLLTYAILDNHFHHLVHVPPAQPVDDTTFLDRLALLYPRPVVQALTDELRRRREEGSASAAETLKAPFVKRMYDLSLFMKTLKQRLTQSYNRRHGRKGTLWESRFKSVLTGGEGAVAAVAAYITSMPCGPAWWTIPRTTVSVAMRKRWPVAAKHRPA